MDYTVNLPSGKVVEVKGAPEGLSREELKAGLISRGSATEEDFATPAPAPQQVDPLAATRQQMQAAIPNPVTAPAQLPYGMPRSVVDAAAKSAEDTKKKLEEAMASDLKTRQFQLASEAPGIVAAMVSAGNEVNELGAGIAELGDKYLPAFLSNAMHSGNSTPQERMNNRAKEMAQNKEMQDMMDLAHPVTSALGSGLPYIASDFLLTPAARAVAAVPKGAARGVLKGISKVAGAVENNPSKLNILRSPARELNTVAQGQLNQPALNIFANQATEDFLVGAPLKGAIEGAVNYNDTAGQGAFSSMLGQGMSHFGLRKLGATENVLSESEKEAVERARRFGYRATPGMVTGNSRLQTMEKGMRSDPIYRDFFRERDIANKTAMANVAADAMGMERRANTADYSPDELNFNMSKFKEGYTDIQNRTSGQLGQSEITQIGDILKNAQPTTKRNNYPEAVKRFNVMNNINKEFRDMNAKNKTYDANGNFTGYKFDGKSYQDIRSKLQNEASVAYAKGDKKLGDSLNDMRDIFDRSLENGMDSATLAQWKDLNEKYAMTNLVLKHGMDPLGGLDVAKLSDKLMSDDEAIRTLTNKGKNIQLLQSLVKTRELEKRQFGEVGWSGSDIIQERPNKVTLGERMLKMPSYLSAGGTNRLMFNTYMGGYPARTGIIPLTPRMLSRVARSTEQGGETYQEGLTALYEGTKKAGESLAEWAERFRNGNEE